MMMLGASTSGRRPSPLTELWTELGLIGIALASIPQMLQEPARGLFRRYYMLASVESIKGVIARAALLGALLIGYVVNVIAADAQSAIRLLVAVVLREGGPLLAALIIMARVGIELTGQFVRMRERGEGQGLRLLRIEPITLFGAPCLLGMAAATVILSLYFNIVTVVGGVLLSSLIADLSVIELAERFLLQVRVGDIFYALSKSALFGLCIGTVSCYHGLMAPLNRLRDGPKVVSRGVMQSLFLISIVNAAAAYVVHGIVLFGVVRT